jgi:elongation factor P
MGTINASELKNGVKLLLDNAPYICISVDFVKPGKGTAFYKTRVQNLLTGNVLDRTLRTGDKVETADVVDTDMEYLYADGDGFVFMDTTNYEQLTISRAVVGDTVDLLLENTACVVTLWNGQPIALRLPNQITVEVTYTEPAVKGDTQSRVMKDATIETGATIQVPTFVAIGDKVAIDTRTRAYISRK